MGKVREKIAVRGVEKWVGPSYFMLSGGAGKTKTEKKSAFLSEQANKHDRQHKRKNDWGPKAFLPKGLRTHNVEGHFHQNIPCWGCCAVWRVRSRIQVESVLDKTQKFTVQLQ